MQNLTSNVNLLQPSGFKITINRENYSNLEFFAQSVQHPNVSGEGQELNYRGSSLKSLPDKLTFGDLSVMILVDEDLNSYTEVLDWMRRNVDNNEVNATDNGINSRCDITVSILSSHNNVNKQIKYVDAYPSDLGDLSLETMSGEQTYITCSATFKYSYFEIL